MRIETVIKAKVNYKSNGKVVILLLIVGLIKKISLYFLVFAYRGFSSQTLAIHRTVGEGRRPSFIPLNYIHLLTNTQTFIATLHVM